MEYDEHGGACCGISHVYNMDMGTPAQLDAILARHDDEEGDHGQGPVRVLECVLSQRQLYPNGDWEENQIHATVSVAGGWGNVLAARNFRLVGTFINSNSQKQCYIFHRLADPSDWLPVNNLPFAFNNGEVQPVNVPPQPAPIQVVKVLYFNMYADGRKGALYPSQEAIERAAPRCRRRFQLQIRSDGTELETEL